jgi:hypothetical protein
MTQKNNAGRKANATAKDLNTLIEKAEYEMKKCHAQNINDLPELYDLRRQIAMGYGPLGKAASITNRKSAIDSCIEMAEKYAIGDAELLNKGEKAPSEETPEPTEVKQVSGGDVVDDSFAAKKAAWAKKKAEAEK